MVFEKICIASFLEMSGNSLQQELSGGRQEMTLTQDRSLMGFGFDGFLFEMIFLPFWF